MAGIVFFYEDYYTDVFSGSENILGEWNHICKIAGIKRVIIVNGTNQAIIPFDADMDIKVIGKSDFSEKICEGTTAMLVCPWDNFPDKIKLETFDHKIDWYVFGPASGWKEEIKADKYVYLPQESKAALHSLHIASAVMFDRYNKIK